jgi:hypothetical protein
MNLTWTAVTTHTDNSPVGNSEVVGYDVYDAISGSPALVASVTANMWPLPADLAVGTHIFTVVAKDANPALNSAPSAPLSFVVAPPAPAALSAPTGLAIS